MALLTYYLKNRVLKKPSIRFHKLYHIGFRKFIITGQLAESRSLVLRVICVHLQRLGWKRNLIYGLVDLLFKNRVLKKPSIRFHKLYYIHYRKFIVTGQLAESRSLVLSFICIQLQRLGWKRNLIYGLVDLSIKE